MKQTFLTEDGETFTNEWLNCPTDISEYWGFVYKITNLTNNKKYIGRCNFWAIEKKKPLKGRVNKRHVKKETKWRDYFGSGGKEWQEVLTKIGKENIRREILVLCSSKWEVKYREAELQFKLGVLLKEEYYNGIIDLKLPKAPKDLRI